MTSDQSEVAGPNTTQDGKDSRVPAGVKGLSLVSLFNDFASEMVYPLLPAFVTRTLGGSAVTLGLLDGASELTASALKWISGRLADRPGWRRPLILTGYATAVLVRPLIAGTSAAWQVVSFRVVDRIGKGLRTPPRDALIAEITPPELRGRAFGYHRGADHFGAVLGSLAAWWLLRQGAPVRSVIGWSVVPGVVAFLVLAGVLRSRQTPAVSRQESATDPSRVGGVPLISLTTGDRGLAPHSLWPPLLALTALSFFRLPETLLILRLQDRGVPVTLVPLIWAGLHVVRSASSYPGGHLSDRRGARLVVAAGGILFALIAFVLGLMVGPVAAVTLFLVLGLVAGLTESGERSMIARLAPVRMGRGFGAYHALTGIAALPAGLVFGELYQSVGGHAALWASAAGMLASVIAWLAVSPAGTGSAPAHSVSPGGAS
jgi:MFS family permease